MTRRWWQWPLWSPGRLIVTLLALLAVAAVANLAISGGSAASSPASSTAVSSSGSSAASSPSPGAEDEDGAGSEDRPADTIDPATAAAITAVVDHQFVPAWLSPDPAARAAGMAAAATPRLIELVSAVPPLDFTATGPAVVTQWSPGHAVVEVPLSTGRRAVLGMTDEGAGWKVSTLSETTPPPATASGDEHRPEPVP